MGDCLICFALWAILQLYLLLDLNMASSVKAIIFDFDGTLYDFSFIPIRVILREPHHIFWIRADRVTHRMLRGRDFGSSESFVREYNRRMAKHTRLSEEENIKWYTDTYIKKTMVKVLKRHYRCRDGLRSFVSMLRQKNILMAVFSDYPFVSERMLAVDMDQEMIDCFAKISSAHDFGCLKPAPRAFLEIAHSLGVPPENCLVVGDRDDTDGEGARNSGMQFIQICKKKSKGNPSIMTWTEFVEWAEKEFN